MYYTKYEVEYTNSVVYHTDNVTTILNTALNKQMQNDTNFILKWYVIAASDDTVDVE